MHDILIYINNIFQSLGLSGLAINAMIEGCLPGFPLPPDVLLCAMSISTPVKALFFALICTMGSVTGGCIGYSIGLWGGRPLFIRLFSKHADKIDLVEKMYQEYGTFAVFFAAFTPVPYNVFTIASGILRMNFIKFFLASIFGRGARFFLVALVLMFFGEAVKKYIDIIILTGTVALIIFGIILYKKRGALTGGTKKEFEVKDDCH